MDYKDELRHISQRIKQIRMSKKISIQELAYRCDIERSNLSRIEAGRANITMKTICRICNALEISLKDVMR